MPAVVLTTSLPAHATSTNSALTVDIASATITAGASSNVTATVKDSQGRPWAGQLVTLSLSGPSGTSLGTTTGTTNSAGQVTTTLSTDAFTANGATLTVTATSGPLTSTDTATITGGVTLTVSTAPQITAGAANSVTATLKKASGTAISGKTVTFSVTGIDGTFNTSTGTTNGSGEVAVNLTPNTWTKPGAAPTITVTTGPATATAAPIVLGANALAAGLNVYSQLGDGTTTNRTSLTQPLRMFPSPIKQIEVGGFYQGSPGYFTYFLLENGTVWSVGKNNRGQLGLGDTTDRTVPTLMASISNIDQIAAGDDTGYAVTKTGQVYAWGNNESGEVGDNSTTQRNSPTLITALNGLTIRHVAAGNASAIALTSDGIVKAWGFNGSGQLGDGTTTTRLSPVNVSGLDSASDITQIAYGGSSGYALYTDGPLKGRITSWGSNGYGQLGDGSTDNRLTPVFVSGITGATQIAAAYVTAYALVSGGIQAWGGNDIYVAGGVGCNGMVGDGTAINRLTPVGVQNLGSGVSQIGASLVNAFALKDDGTILAWGYNYRGQLGIGSAELAAPSATPVTVPNPSGLPVARLQSASSTGSTSFYVLTAP